MEPALLAQAIKLMEADIKLAQDRLPFWLTEVVATDESGKEFTPLQLLQEVKQQTPFGLRYAEGWIDRHLRGLIALHQATHDQEN